MAVDFDVTSLHHRRATHRWERTSVGDLFERMTWSFPGREVQLHMAARTSPASGWRPCSGCTPGVARSAVVGLPHPRWGEAVTALVIRTPGDTPTGADLIAHCRASLAGYETPKDVVFVDSLPETVGGKVLKYKLRVMFADHYESADAVR